MLAKKPKFLHEFEMEQRINDEGKVILDFFYDENYIVLPPETIALWKSSTLSWPIASFLGNLMRKSSMYFLWELLNAGSRRKIKCSIGESGAEAILLRLEVLSFQSPA